MAGQGKASRLKSKYAVLSSNSSTNVNWTYHITSAATITLPNVGSLSVGDKVTFTKEYNIIPTIQRQGVSELIKVRKKSDTAVFFDIESEIIFVWDGSNWRV